MPGKAIDQEIDGIKYKQEVELPNGHKWRQRLDGGWCRFSKRTCFPKSKTKQFEGNQPHSQKRRTHIENDSGLKNHARKHSNLSPEEYLARGKKNIAKGQKLKGGKYPDAMYFVRSVGDDSYSITITNKKGGILSIDTWTNGDFPITKELLLKQFKKNGITPKKNFWSNFS